MKRRCEQHRELLEDIARKQRNVQWPEAIENVRGVDELLLKGNPRATIVQRIGVAVFGLGFLCAGLLTTAEGIGSREPIETIASLAILAFGLKVTCNAFRRNKTREEGGSSRGDLG